MIGKLLTKPLKTTQINEILKSTKHKIVNLSAQSYDICTLSNGYLISANYGHKNLTIYDENFSLILTVDKIDRENVQSLFLATNNIDRVYINDYISHKIIVTDYDFNMIKSIGSLNIPVVFVIQINFYLFVIYTTNGSISLMII